MFYFATLFDINYLSRGLTLLHSLNTVLQNNFHLYILTLDNETYDYFGNNPINNITPISLSEIEIRFPELSEAKNNRTKIEYYFTLSPILPLFILDKFKVCNRITTLDADIYFFSSPEPVFNSFSQDAILITPHDFSKENIDKIIYGSYNVSFQSFPRNPNSEAILMEWKSQCLNWCKDKLDPDTGNFADQKYLDSWTERFDNVRKIDLKTCGRAPWNISKIPLKYRGDIFLIDTNPLIYFHFHHLRINGKYLNHGLHLYGLKEVSKSLKELYETYINILLSIEKKININNEQDIKRYENHIEKSFIIQIWKQETGAILFLNKFIFFDIRKLKRIQNSILNLLRNKNLN